MTAVDRCAANNVDWYTAVLGAHGITGSVDRGVWLTRAEVPPTPADLERWEAAWRKGGSPAATRVFPPPLLTDPAVRFAMADREGRIVAGCAANRSPDAIGFSNHFVLDGDADELLSGAVAWTAALAPGLPVVGWESGGGLDRAVRLGFRTVGPLRIWIRGSVRPDARDA